MSRRTRARETAFQLLYQEEIAAGADPEWEQNFLRLRLNQHRGLIQFASGLLAGVRRHREQIDQTLARWALRWQVQRMPVVDRSIARLAVYEIQFGDTPKPVAIDEAIILAKRFGSAQTYQFLNGILDKIDKPRRPAAPTPVPEP